ncbi:MAG: hypothetical protein IK092_00015 [Muribaculaceae bacterium]|nr:hypothetical protein [Muribaculaceae bacterium]
MKKIILLLIAAFGVAEMFACTSAIVGGELTVDGRPLLWKHRDTDDQNNKIERIAKPGCFEYVALFNASDLDCNDAWMGMNEKGFAIMNTASYNINKDDVKLADQEGVVMSKALQRCVTTADFERLLDTLPKPLGVEANFGVIDAQGNGAYYETGNFGWKKFDLADEPSHILTRTNYSYSGRENEGYGYIREQNEKALIAKHITAKDFTPAVFTEELSRTYYHAVMGENFNNSGKDYIVDQDFIPRRISTATVVIQGVKPGEDPGMTVTWVGLGYPPCSEIRAVVVGDGVVPLELTGSTADGHSIIADRAQERKAQVFDIKRGNGKNYIHLSKLYNAEGTGFCQQLIPINMEYYKKMNEIIDKRRKAYKTTK